jgi:hypothetical protein
MKEGHFSAKIPGQLSTEINKLALHRRAPRRRRDFTPGRIGKLVTRV